MHAHTGSLTGQAAAAAQRKVARATLREERLRNRGRCAWCKPKFLFVLALRCEKEQMTKGFERKRERVREMERVRERRERERGRAREREAA